MPVDQSEDSICTTSTRQQAVSNAAQLPPGNRQLATLHNFHPATGSYSHAAQLPPGNRQLATLHVVHARKIVVSLRQAVDVVAVEVVVCFLLPRFVVPRGRWSASGFQFLVLMSLQVCLWVPFSVTPLASGLPLGSTLCYSCRFRSTSKFHSVTPVASGLPLGSTFWYSCRFMSTSGFRSLLLLSLQVYLWVPLSVTPVASGLPLGSTLWYSSSFRSTSGFHSLVLL